VATQSLVLLGCGVAEANHAPSLVVLMHALWSIGLILYGIFIAHAFYLIFYVGVQSDDLTPALWIVMGAAAISANSGAMLAKTSSILAVMGPTAPLIVSTSFALWAWGTWCVPLLVILGIWKHGIRRAPLRYDIGLWSIVFPLGMHVVATRHLAAASDLLPLASASSWVAWLALAAWVATASGLTIACFKSIRGFHRPRIQAQQASL
jgi:tellurite resistance protein TehA-like permease